ncbi:hypothetical protein NXW62_18620 [Bacteroides fragilis]|nr:hypothetical protein [Bacteroides fragilis]
MKNKEIKKALKSDTPINSMYALIPGDRMRSFKSLLPVLALLKNG